MANSPVIILVRCGEMCKNYLTGGGRGGHAEFAMSEEYPCRDIFSALFRGVNEVGGREYFHIQQCCQQYLQQYMG